MGCVDIAKNGLLSKILNFFLATIAAIFASVAFAGSPPALSVGSEIKKFRLKPEDVALYAADGPHVLISHNADKFMIPASVTKILTAAAALKVLEPTTKVATEILSENTVDGSGVLRGPLYLRGGGDPGFVSETLWNLVNDFTRLGVNRVEGDIFVDDTLFDKVRFDPDRDPVRNDRAYDAPVGAMSMNWNAVNVYIRPGSKVGEPARVFADPETRYIQVTNQTKTTSGDRVEVTVSRKGTTLGEDDTVEAGDHLVLSGRVGKDAPEKVIYKKISQPDLWSGHNLQAFLAHRGINVSGGVRAGKVPRSAKLLVRVESKPVSAMVLDMMKFSNNFVAEMLTKQMALKLGSEPATLSKGVEVLRGFLKSIGAEESSVKVYSPSGFSHKNQITAQGLYRVLLAVRNDFQESPEFLASLPVSGKDGTLKSRMQKVPQKVRAKTGYMAGIVSLAGFVDRGPGESVPFAFLFNGPAEKADEAKAFMDYLCERLAKK